MYAKGSDYMEKFLKDYVKMYANANGSNLSKKQLQEIVNSLMNEEEIWNTLDSYIYNYLEELD